MPRYTHYPAAHHLMIHRSLVSNGIFTRLYGGPGRSRTRLSPSTDSHWRSRGSCVAAHAAFHHASTSHRRPGSSCRHVRLPTLAFHPDTQYISLDLFPVMLNHGVDHTLAYLKRSKSAPTEVEMDLGLLRAPRCLISSLSISQERDPRSSGATIKKSSWPPSSSSPPRPYGIQKSALVGTSRASLATSSVGRHHHSVPPLSMTFTQHSKPISHSPV